MTTVTSVPAADPTVVLAPPGRPRTPDRWFVGPVIAIAGAVLAVIGHRQLAKPITGCPGFHLATQLSASDVRLQDWLGTSCQITSAQVHSTLLWDGLFLVGYVAIVVGVLRPFRGRFVDSPLTRAMDAAWLLGPIAGAFDLCENLGTWAFLRVGTDDHLAYRSTVGPLVVATFAWLKWLVLFVGLLLIAVAALFVLARGADLADHDRLVALRDGHGPLAPPLRAGSRLVHGLRGLGATVLTRVENAPARDTGELTPSGVTWAGPGVEPLGVCCSGGGIRAAAFSIGALSSLEKAGVMRRARWLTAVSGGSYAATAWRLAKVGNLPALSSEPPVDVGDRVIRWLETAEEEGALGRHRFLRNGPGGLGRALLAALSYVLLTLLAEAVFVFLFAWPLGRLLASRAVAPALRDRSGHLPDAVSISRELWGPGVVVLVVALVVLLASTWPSWKVGSWWKVAGALAGVGVLLEAVLAAMPYAMLHVGGWLSGGRHGTATPAATAGGLTVLSVATTVWRLVRSPIESQLRARAPKLGGVLLAGLVVLWGGKVATDAALRHGTFASPNWWQGAVVAFVVFYLFTNTSELSLHRVYRKRLRRTFGLSLAASGALFSPDERLQTTWEQLAADSVARAAVDPVPELVVCCAQERSGLAPGGFPAASFTISERAVHLHDCSTASEDSERDGTRQDVATYLQRLPYRARRERLVSSWMATSGAAFASAMGRMSVGSTTALMAALNINLGVWLPNPATNRLPRLPRVRFGYLAKQIIGRYDLRDGYVFVTDGGHWENLGLVELLRRQCRTVICIDASGDTVGTFTTLRQAAALALLELPRTVKTIDLARLDAITAAPGSMAATNVTTLAVTYVDGTTAAIYYAKASVAADLDVAVRRYAAGDPRFPNYSTGNQFLTSDQFAQLVALGRAAGTRVIEHLDAATARTAAAATSAGSTTET